MKHLKKQDKITNLKLFALAGCILGLAFLIIIPVFELVAGNPYGWFVPRTGWGYVSQHGEHWVWLAPQTDHELLYGNFTLADDVVIADWLPDAFPTYYTISWGIITNINPY